MPAIDRRKDLDSRSQLYAQFAALEDAGVPLGQALETLRASSKGPLAAAVAGTQLELTRARGLAVAGQAAGLFLPWEAQLIAAASEGGKLSAVYHELSRHWEQATRRSRLLKSRLIMPAVVLLIAAFVMPLPALARGEFGIAGYVGRTLLPVVAVLIGLRMLASGWRDSAALASTPPGWGLLRALPRLGSLLLRLQQYRGLSMLALLLAGGLPMDRALRLAGSSLRDPLLRKTSALAASRAAHGSSAADAIAFSGLCDEPHGLALISSGEAAGRLDESISHYTTELDFRLGLQLDLLAEWLPRVLYFGILLLWLI